MKSFDLVRKSHIDSLDCDIHIYKHNKTGAEVLYVDSDDIEKVFTIQFRTLPKTDNGICHIIEHSVLCGSRKYNVKEPFVDLIKASMNTFLNAMTFPDKTVYPLATTNDKELLNLMDVYLDAVFFPNMYNDEYILAQEGWHYEVDSNDKLFINGVVYNEMKGAYSNPEDLLYQKVSGALFDNVYSVDSGGHPNAIPTLTQKEFLDFHKRYYHPTNSVSYLYGKMDVERALDKLDEYFSQFEMGEKAEVVEPTKPFDAPKKVYIPYSVIKKEKDQALLGIGIAQGSYENIEENLALKLASAVLFSMPSSPIKNMLLESGLVHDIFASFDDSVVQPTTLIFVRGAEEDNIDTIIESIFFEIERLVEEGLDRDLVDGSINQMKFALKEGADQFGMSKGILYGLDAIGNMDRGQNPEDRLDALKYIEELETKLDDKYLEDIIKKYYLDNNHRAYVVMTPDDKLMNREKEQFEAKMSKIQFKMSDKDIEDIKRRLEILREKQTTPDKKEDVDSIPKISIEDICRSLESVEYKEKLVGKKKMKTFIASGDNNGISYLNIDFDKKDIKTQDLCDLSVLIALIGYLSTEERSHIELSNDVMKYIGDINIEPVVYKNGSKTSLYVESKIKFLDENYKKSLDIFAEAISKTIFDEEDRILGLLNKISGSMEMEFLERGNRIAKRRVESYFDAKYFVEEYVSGIEFYRYIKDLAENFEQKKDKLITKLKEIFGELFRIEDTTVVFIGKNEEVLDYLYEKLDEIETNTCSSKKNNGTEEACGCGTEEVCGCETEEVCDCAESDSLNLRLEDHLNSFKPINKAEGFLIPSEVNYIAKGYNFIDLGYKFDGSLLVAKQIIDTDYLWEKLRVVGGAYGGGMSVNLDGNIVFTSFRDPNVKSSLDTYDGVGDYIENLSMDEEELKRYIIGTASTMVKPLSNDTRLSLVVKELLESKTLDFRQKIFEEILDTTVDKLKQTSKIFKDVTAKNYYAALGSSKLETKDVEFEIEKL